MIALETVEGSEIMVRPLNVVAETDFVWTDQGYLDLQIGGSQMPATTLRKHETGS